MTHRTSRRPGQRVPLTQRRHIDLVRVATALCLVD
ncbi:putative leader peptide [Cryptosporangium aurantiacum]